MIFRNLYLFSISLLLLLVSARAMTDVEKIDANEVPIMVKNAFNRFYVDVDPEYWYVSTVKLKGQKKTRRYTARFVKDDLTHAIRFDEEGHAVADYIILSDEEHNDFNQKVKNLFPDFDLEQVKSVRHYHADVHVYKLVIAKNSKSEVIFLDQDGDVLEHEILEKEFKQ